ncbi:hypothetical protein GCM10007420_18350 [Glycocaulis albus]|uniref:DUF817 domain-containing protein n=1 Tax=Glycocaulis albus TaxID=1382801 RepID=A0ABQ1XTH3_9PROT|nr:DUF817 domain-containing protein [Glycocaulis albus]GGH02415.1 hypothetical protein GCM10007420_18350 [Glycocaulis albus]
MLSLRQLEAAFHRMREALRTRLVRGRWSGYAFEFLAFGIKQGWACMFGALMLVVLLGTFLFYPEGAALPRYDFITLAAILIQIAMLAFGLETLEEAKVIAVFHVVGTVMEIFKVAMGSWIYPEAGEAMLVIAGVPLFSGFMYAAVGSYLARVWRLFDFRYDRFAPLWLQGLLALAIYVNFFTHHFALDIRLGLFALSALIYGPCVIWFRPDRAHRCMPLLLGLVLVALFIWFAENIGTFARAWAYPGQEAGWHMVSLAKLGSWYLLMIISFVLVAAVHRVSGPRLRDPR